MIGRSIGADWQLAHSSALLYRGPRGAAVRVRVAEEGTSAFPNTVVRAKSMEICKKKSFFSTEIDADNSFNYLGKIEIPKMGPISHFLRGSALLRRKQGATEENLWINTEAKDNCVKTLKFNFLSVFFFILFQF